LSLVEVRIRDLAVFDEMVVPFDRGFTALTGETGAGKSVCITAMRLALGGRVDGDPVRNGADSARAVAVFDEIPPFLRRRLGDIGVPPDDLTTLSRELSRAGRGSCRINGALVSQAVLREAGEALAEITLQGASQRLLQRGRQRDLLDLAAAAIDLRDEVRHAVGSWRTAQTALDEVRRRQAAGAAEVEAARHLIADLGALALVPGEDDRLGAERLRLRNASALMLASSELRRAAAGDEESSGAAALLAAALDSTTSLDGLDADLDSLAGEAADLLDRLRELGASARSHADGIGLDEGRLAEVEERLDTLARVRRRHGSIAEALEALEAANDLLAAGQDGGARLATAEAEVTAARARAGAVALQLSERRRRAARRLEGEVERALHLLELPHARLRIATDRDDKGILESCRETRQPARRGLRVIIDERHQVSGGGLDATVSRPAEAATLGVRNHVDAGKARSKRFAELVVVIGHDNDLGPLGLGEHGPDAGRRELEPLERISADDDTPSGVVVDRT